MIIHNGNFCKTAPESIAPDEIILDARGKFPKKVVFKNARGETIMYRLMKTKFDRLTLNK